MNAGDPGLVRHRAGSPRDGKLRTGNSAHAATGMPAVLTVPGRIPIMRRGTLPDGTVLGGTLPGSPVLGGAVLGAAVLGGTLPGSPMPGGAVLAEMAPTRQATTSRAGQPRRNETGCNPGGRR